MNYICKSSLRAGILVWLVACVVVGASEKLRDEKLGFSLTLPAGFQKHPALVGATPDIIHAYILGDLEDELPDILLLIERMRGTIGRERLSADQMPAGFGGSLFTATWKGFKVDGFEVPETIQGKEFVTYNLQIPLKREAIQLKLFGLKNRKPELDDILTEVLSGLDGESNWIAAVNESAASSPHYGSFLMILSIVLIVSGLVVFRLISQKAPKGTLLLVAVLVYAAGWMIPDVRMREVLLLRGVFKMLGFAGIILGLIDFFRKRRSSETK